MPRRSGRNPPDRAGVARQDLSGARAQIRHNAGIDGHNHGSYDDCEQRLSRVIRGTRRLRAASVTTSGGRCGVRKTVGSVRQPAAGADRAPDPVGPAAPVG